MGHSPSSGRSRKARTRSSMSLQSLEIQPIGRALVARRADQALDVGLHQDLQHGRGHGAKKVPSPAFCTSSANAILSSVIGIVLGPG